MQGPCQSFANGAKGLRKGCDTHNQHQPEYCKAGGRGGREPARLQPAPETATASSGHTMKNGESDEGKTFRISLKIGLGISFT